MAKAKSQTKKFGLTDGGTRQTYILQEEYVLKIKRIAAIEGVSIREVVEEVFLNYINAYERKRGPIDISEPIKPSKRKKPIISSGDYE